MKFEPSGHFVKRVCERSSVEDVETFLELFRVCYVVLSMSRGEGEDFNFLFWSPWDQQCYVVPGSSRSTVGKDTYMLKTLLTEEMYSVLFLANIWPVTEELRVQAKESVLRQPGWEGC